MIHYKTTKNVSCYIGYLATVLRTCIKTITIIVYKMVVLFIACCTCTVLFFVCILYFFCYCMIVLFVDNLFFYSGGQLVSCKASLAALRLYGFFVILL